MALIRLQNIHISYGEPALLDSLDFAIEAGERIALVGRNGTGKSTLMKIIIGEVTPDDGEVNIQQGVKIARLEQDVPRDLEGSVYDIYENPHHPYTRKLVEIFKKLSLFE